MRRELVADRFELLAHAGRGGMGSVFRARDRISGRVVAVKVLALDRPFDLVRFGREATLLATVHHPNVVEYVAHGMSGNLHYLAQEWVDGTTLFAQMQAVGITVAEAVDVAIGVASALGATHALGMVHRDIKPTNIILVDGDPRRVKLVDFGIARLASEAGVLTRTGMMVGTPSFMAPEQARGLVGIDSAVDVWALGCVLYEALAGRPAFDGRTAAAIRAKVILNRPTPLALLCPDAPDGLIELVEAMLEKDPGRRPASGPSLDARLRALLPVPEGERRRSGHVAQPPTIPMPIRPPKREAPREPEEVTGCYVLITPAEPEQPTAMPGELAKVAERHNCDVHEFDDGSALLVARTAGKAGAIEAARAALALRDGVVSDAAMSVFGKGNDDTLADAIDRGSRLLERAMMGTLFGDLVDETAAEPREVGVPVDDVIARLVAADLPIASTPDGQVLRVVRRAQSPRG
jgi:serine/threonine protein kinase